MKLHVTLFVWSDCFIGLEIAKGVFEGNLSSNKSNNVCSVVLELNISRFCSERVSVGSISLITHVLQMGENK